MQQFKAYIFALPVFLLMSALNAHGDHLTQTVIENSTAFIVTAANAPCYSDGVNSWELERTFSSGERIYTQRHEKWSVYLKRGNKSYVAVRYDDNSFNSCWVEAVSNIISSVDEGLACKHQGVENKRYLITSYDQYPSTLPCRVLYIRENGEIQYIANAENSPSYCAIKRQEFVGKLANWGWSCYELP